MTTIARLAHLALGALVAPTATAPLLAVPALAAAQAARVAPEPRPRSVLPEGTRVVLEAVGGTMGRLVGKGLLPVLRVASPVVVAGDTVVRAGAPAYATVRLARGGGVFGRPGQLVLTLDSVRLADGSAARLDGTYRADGKPQTGPAVVAAILTYGSGGLLLTGGDAALVRCESIETRAGAPAAAPTAVVPPAVPGAGALGGAGAVVVPPCLAAEAALREARRKDNAGAMALGVIFPGAGHIYAGEPGRGMAAAGAATVGSVAMLVGVGRGLSPDYRGGEELFVAGAALYMAAYLYSAIDAPFAARRHNERVLTDPTYLPPGLATRSAVARQDEGSTRRRLALRPVARLALAGRAEGAPTRVPALGVSVRGR